MSIPDPESLPRCSVIVPVYNAAAFLADTIESVRRQTVRDWELILVDDGSTDNSLECLQRMAEPRIQIRHQTNQGPSAARNHGLRVASAPCVFFLDSDDCLAADALERLLAPLDADPGLVAAYGEVATMDEAGLPIGSGAKPLFNARPSGDVVAALVQRNFIVTGGALCLRREAALAVGAFREDLHVAEDLEFWCRLALHGPLQYVPAPPVLRYRIRQGSVVRSRGKDPIDALRCIAAIFENPELQHRLGGETAGLRRKAEASVYSFTANEYLRTGDWPAARKLLGQSLRRNPRQVREVLLYLLACAGWLPAAVRKRLK